MRPHPYLDPLVVVVAKWMHVIQNNTLQNCCFQCRRFWTCRRREQTTRHARSCNSSTTLWWRTWRIKTCRSERELFKSNNEIYLSCIAFLFAIKLTFLCCVALKSQSLSCSYTQYASFYHCPLISVTVYSITLIRIVPCNTTLRLRHTTLADSAVKRSRVS